MWQHRSSALLLHTEKTIPGCKNQASSILLVTFYPVEHILFLCCRSLPVAVFCSASLKNGAILLIVFDRPDMTVTVGVAQRITDETRIGPRVENQQITAIPITGE